MKQKGERAKLRDFNWLLKEVLTSLTQLLLYQMMPESHQLEFNNQDEENPDLQNIPTSTITSVSEPVECENIVPYRMCGNSWNICLPSEYLKPSQFASDNSYCANLE